MNLNDPVMWIGHWITILPKGVEDEIWIWIGDLPRDRIGPLLDAIVCAGEAAVAVSPNDGATEDEVVSDVETPGGEEITQDDDDDDGEEDDNTPPPTANAAGRRDWTPKEDAVVRAAPSPAVAYKMYYDAFPHIKRSKSSIKSRWYRLVRWADEDGDRILPPPDLDHSGLRYGTRVVITGDGEFAGEIGVVKRVNGDTNEVLVAIDGAPEFVWVPTYAVTEL